MIASLDIESYLCGMHAPYLAFIFAALTALSHHLRPHGLRVERLVESEAFGIDTRDPEFSW